MALVRTLLFTIIFYPGSVVLVLADLAAVPFGPRAVRRMATAWTRFHRWCARVLLGIRVRVEGPLPSGPVLIAAKHQAMFETLELVAMLDAPALVMKRELGRIPLWGWLAERYGMIPVDRDGGAAALRAMLKAAQATVREGRAIVIFPEGTRVPPGAQPPLQPGFAGLYRTLGLAVIPLALDSGRFIPRHGFVKRRGVITFRFGPPVPAGLPRLEVEARVHAAINALEPTP